MLTTHSEHILVGLLNAVAAGRLGKGDLAVYEFQVAEGRVRPRRLEVEEGGRIQGDLSGFMEVELDEIGEYLAARLGKNAQ
jgi:predicted ATPase